MNSSSRISRGMAVMCIAPVWLVSLLWGAGYVFVGISELRYGHFLNLLGFCSIGGLMLWISGACFSRMRRILRSQVDPWSGGTLLAIGTDLLLVLLMLVAIQKVQELRRFGADGATRGQLGI